MNLYKNMLIWGCEIVAFLFAAFGGFLTKVAPPDQTGAEFYTGIASFSTLIILLIISGIARATSPTGSRKWWLIAGSSFFIFALAGGYSYWRALEQYTFIYPKLNGTRHVNALDTELKPLAKKWIIRHPNETSAFDLYANLPPQEIWQEEALRRADSTLALCYVWMVTAIASALFCLVEVQLGSNAAQGDLSKGPPSENR